MLDALGNPIAPAGVTFNRSLVRVPRTGKTAPPRPQTAEVTPRTGQNLKRGSTQRYFGNFHTTAR